MTLEAECALSFYREAAALDSEKNIYLVRHVETGDLYVKKQLRVFDLDVYNALRGMRIPGVPAIVELIEDGDVLYVIEEYIHGDNLQKLFEQRGCFGEADITDYSVQLANILESLHAHEPAIVHRDIKPSNLILTKDGVLKLIDFNSAKLVKQDNPQNAHGKDTGDLKWGSRDTVLLGTVHFAAPEQYGFRASDVRTDLFGFAATMNYLLTGKYPSEGVTKGKFGPIFQRCLAMDPNARYQNIRQLKDALAFKDDSFKWFLPVGFRSGKILPMVVFGAYYAMAAYISFVPDGESTLWECINFFLLFMIPVGILGNYGNFHRHLEPFIQNKGIRYAFLTFLAIFVDGILLFFFI